MLTIDLIAKSYSGEINGLSRYDLALYDGLQKAEDVMVQLLHISAPKNFILDKIYKLSGLDIATFLGTYPLKLPKGSSDVIHITTSSNSFALFRKPYQKVVITVHDIIHFTYRHNKHLSAYNNKIHSFVDSRSLYNLKNATAIIASSNYTRQELISHLKLPQEKISVVPLGVDLERFRPCNVPTSFYEKYRLDKKTHYILHISSEEPRKNIDTLFRAWSIIQKDFPEAILLKVGRCLYPYERLRLLNIASSLGIEKSIRFIDEVPDADLLLFYNIAKIFAFPSFSEGFGFPVLEAMACGTPVVCSSAPALSELVYDIALQHEPTDYEALALQLKELLINTSLYGKLVENGIKRANKYTWQKTIEKTIEIYEN